MTPTARRAPDCRDANAREATRAMHGLRPTGGIAGPLRVPTVDLPGRGDSDWCDDAGDYGDALCLSALEARAPLALDLMGGRLPAGISGAADATRDPVVRKALAALSMELPDVDSSGFARLIVEERKRWLPVVDASGFSADK
jgi:hypothetical protein